MSLSGSVKIEAFIADNQLQSVSVRSLRPALAQKLVEGKPLIEAANIISQCYVVCKQAQTLAANLAIKQQTSDGSQLVRIQLESIDQTLWRWMIDLPRLFGLPASMPDYAKIKQQIFHWLMDSYSSSKNLGNSENPDLSKTALWFEELVGVSATDFYQLSPSEIQNWILTSTNAGDIVKQAIAMFPIKSSIEDSTASGYVQQLRRENRPDWMIETINAIALKSAEEQQWFNESGEIWSVPVVQLLTRLRQLAKTIHQLMSDIAQLDYGIKAHDNQALTWVMTARGWLLHNITLTCPFTKSGQGSVSNYQILSPTDCYFRNNGQVQETLNLIEFINPQQIKTAIELVVLASDPEERR